MGMDKYDKRHIFNLAVFTLIGVCFFLIILTPKEQQPEYELCCDEPVEYVEPVKQPEPIISDWTLSIPDIDLLQQMEEIHTQGKEIPVPENNPGYLITNDHNIFIVGHNGTTFKRLNEIPRYIAIYQDNKPIAYALVKSEQPDNENISMKALLDYDGIVLMTCAGDYIDGHYTQRLILYYK